MTTSVVHRPGCDQPGWTITTSRAVRGLTIARCRGCGAVSVTREDQR